MVNFSFPQGALSQGGQIPVTYGQQPVLAQRPYTPPVSAAQLSKYTSNARQSRGMNFPMIPDNRINMGTEGLMRIGGAMMGGARDGALSAYSAGMDAYGGIQDYNRQADMERMAIEQDRMLEEQRRQDLMRKMNATGKKKDEKTPQEASNEISRLEGILADLKNDPNLTGPIAGSLGHKYDRSGLGDPSRAAKRLILAELQVNATLAYTAQTKGAITDREMALFAKPVPQLTDDEQMWIDWLEPQLAVLKQLQQNGITDEAAKQQGITPSNSGSTSEPTVDQSVIDAANAIINGG